MTSQLADQASGVLQGVADATQGVMHEVRAGHSDRDPSDRSAAAHARWQAGLPARNTYERDAYASIEANLAAGMDRLARLGKQASEMEAAAQQAEHGGPEAGS
jgi:hypothetical protein